MRRSREGPAAEVMKGSRTRPHPPPGQCDWLLELGVSQEPLAPMPRHCNRMVFVGLCRQPFTTKTLWSFHFFFKHMKKRCEAVAGTPAVLFHNNTKTREASLHYYLR